MTQLCELTIGELQKVLRSREASVTEVVESYLLRIDRVEGTVGAFLVVDREGALASARALDEDPPGEAPPGCLWGIPLAIKDNICTAGLRTTCASKILHNFVPPYDATVVERLRYQGAVLLGKTNMDEFAMGSSTENSAFQLTRNPWDLEKVPGGSSGGSAACVAAREAAGALGSDTGGSIRQPASFCGVVGMKPTYGLVSRYGLVAFASSLDQIGPITRDVMDCALVLDAIAGHDPRDSTSVPGGKPSFHRGLAPARSLSGLRVGLPREYFAEGIDPVVKELVLRAVRRLEEEGALVLELSMPHTEYALATYYLIAPAEASSNLSRYDGVRFGLRGSRVSDAAAMYKSTRQEGFGAEVKRRIMLGTYALSAGYYDAYYLKALKVRTLLKQDFDRAFEQCDVLVTPTSPTPAFGIGEKVDDPLKMYLSDICTITANLAGIPAVSVPCGSSSTGLPVGLQLMGPPFSEELLLRAALAVELGAKMSGDFNRERDKPTGGELG
ncbi:MAG: Asp-tRNA(Asn)/Glu-tRNA(Gln) amidotransferase subunit GatA [Firmicutes bacterium]|nr:Asp-tRNA(Asn)/Glu-tRNA(Gln) amidotransferase subunit GatA [Bacillota bacterium]